MQLRGGKRKREENELEKEEKVKENEIQGETRRIKKGELDEKTVGEGFRCGICFEIMSWERSPRVLPCGHSFCSECLSKLLHIQQQQQQPQTPPSSSLHGDSDVPPHFPEPQIPHRLSRTTPPTHLIDKRVTLPTPLSSSSTSSSSSSISFSFSFSSGEVGTSSVGKGNCPFCRSVIECKSIESLPHNYLIPETIDVLLSSQVLSLDHSPEEKSRCVNFKRCGEQTSMYCPNCEVFICDSCNLSHSSSVFTQNHKRQQQSSYSAGGGSNSFETIKKKHCSEHSSEFVFGYCFGCSVFVCGCCILGSHSEHKEMIFSLAESAKKRRDQVAKIGDDLRRRMQVIEKIQQENVDEIKSLKEKLMKKEKEQKELELEIGDLKMRHDTIGRLSNMPTDDSILNENIFSTLLQTANDLVDEMIQKKETFEEREDTRELQVSFPWEGSPWGVSANSGGNILVAERMKNVTLRNRENGSLIRTFDSLNRSFGLFDDPIDVSCGTEDQVVVLDTAKCQVVIFNKEGHYVRSFGSCGSRYGEFKGPCSVVVDKENQIIVADSGNHRIQVFGSDGRFIRCFGR